MLLEVLRQHRDLIVATAKQRTHHRTACSASARRTSSVEEALDHVETVLLATGGDVDAIAASSALQGRRYFQQGAPITQLVHVYGALREAIDEAVRDRVTAMPPEGLQLVHACLDEVTALAAGEYLRLHTLTAATNASEPLGVLTREVRSHLDTASVALDEIRTARASSRESVATLGRSVRLLRALVDGSARVLRSAEQLCEPRLVPVHELVADLIIPARTEASERDLRLVVMPVDNDVAVLVDRMAITAALASLLHNALKFTRQWSSVTLSVLTTPHRVLIEVADECGGLPENTRSALSQRAERPAADTGLGLGLVVARRAVEAGGGLLRVRDRPGEGCVFTAELPRGLQT